MKKETLKKLMGFILRVIIYLLLSGGTSTAIRIIGGIIRGEHGAPSFATVGFQIFGFVTSLLLVVAYLLIGYKIPIKNKALRGLTFMMFFWISSYLSQILGIMGADSPYMSSDAVSISTILSDSIGYIFSGIFLGLLLTIKESERIKPCKPVRLIISSVVSSITFTAVMLILEVLIGLINPDFVCSSAFGINENETTKFYIIFYIFQAISGFIFPIFYRSTEYNSKVPKWVRFASVYGWMLWTPIVIIVAFFGVSLPATIAFAVIMLIAVYTDTYAYTRILKQE